MLGPLPAAHRATLTIGSMVLGALLGLCLALAGIAVGSASAVSPSLAATLGAAGAALVAVIVLADRPVRRGGRGR